jgi:hypothetical protein
VQAVLVSKNEEIPRHIKNNLLKASALFPTSLMLDESFAIQPASLRHVSTRCRLREVQYLIRPVSRLRAAADGGVREEIMGGWMRLHCCHSHHYRDVCSREPKELEISRTCTPFFILEVYRTLTLFPFSEDLIQVDPFNLQFMLKHACYCFFCQLEWQLVPC